MNPSCPVSCIILSAGDSGRMGRHKALLPFGNHEITFLEKICQTYHHSEIHRIIVVVNSELYKTVIPLKLDLPGNVEFIVNPHPEKGRFYSLQTGLMQVKTGSFVFIQNVDNPFIDGNTLAKLINYRELAEVVLPSFSGKGGHPVLINPHVCGSIIRCDSPEVRIDGFLKEFSSVNVEVNESRILANINTPEDYRNEFDTGIHGL